MIEAICECGAGLRLPESQVSTSHACARCGAPMTLLCSEVLGDGNGAGDFDARLVVTAGPDRVGEHLLLGGVTDIDVGKLPQCHLILPGGLVSRLHCRLKRVDFGPSRWVVEDNESKNGLFVDGRRVSSAELKTGQVLRIGEYEFRFSNAPPAHAMARRPSSAAPGSTGDGAICPCCEVPIGRKARICTQCGVHVPSGRPVLISQGLDEDNVHVQAENVIQFVSWLMPVTVMPIPIASEAFGTRKPYATWFICGLTVLVSLLFFMANWSEPTWQDLMLWAPDSELGVVIPKKTVRLIEREMSSDERHAFWDKRKELKGTVPDRHLDTQALRAVDAEIEQILAQIPSAEHRPHQFFTHALLHDTNGLLGFIFHLGGNMLFLLVFGSRVNALVGNVAMAIVYPVLAVIAATTHLVLGEPSGAMLGASGAVMGMAGMYLVLFPVHKVYCAMWFRLRFVLEFTVFALRGYWILLIYIGYDALMTLLGVQDGTAHWAHLGGFGAGVLFGLAILFSRQFNCRGGDLLSVMMGKHAWPLIGKPNRWAEAV